VNKKEPKYERIGWIFFILCSLFYIASSFHAKDIYGLIGGILFFVGCLFFI